MSGLLAHQTMLDTAGGVQLVDEVIERYVAWREERDAVRAGYEAWSSGAEEERTIRFAVYNVAVDREECAASLYAESIGRLRRFLSSHHEP